MITYKGFKKFKDSYPPNQEGMEWESGSINLDYEKKIVEFRSILTLCRNGYKHHWFLIYN